MSCEARGDLGALRALAHDVAGAPTPGNQQQRIDDDGFAGAGFTRKRGEAGAEFQFGLIDQYQIPQLKMRQHGFRPTPARPAHRRARLGPNAAWSAAAGSSHSRADAAV